ncbi:hypothetical protein [Blastococcus xanthinilyticus]|uniref:Uncharacterized protein n=1 Tax=Blastococcus xanthinilyticus TaxID=1564164 RepID=A0A5S5CLB5_9ACTN|nr:hypothetical protein [Blastococcus xanthinilyticus]TYP81910.1 hypothetical protein BD833_12227 [Blastococcus xanthinilyticus]
MRIRRALTPLSAAAVLAVLLSGCSGSEEDATGASGDAEQESPLTEYLSAAYGADLSPEEQERQFAQQQRETEELVAQCMQDEGFEYRPDTSATVSFSGEDIEWEPDEREWVAQYGYGAVTSPMAEETPAEHEYVDPNADYVATLSESEQTAFYEALHGPMPDEEETSGDASFEYDWTTAGCYGAAQHEVAGEDPAQSEEFKPLFDALNELYVDMASWPGMAELDAEWTACMDAAGHGGHANPMEATDSIHQELNAMYENVGMSDEGLASGEPDQAAIDALGEREVELALADLDCREETDYRERHAEITRQIEQQFIDDHKTELDAMVAAVQQD